MKTTLRLKFLICIAALSMINVNAQSKENDFAEQGRHLKWQSKASQQVLNGTPVKLFQNAKSGILFLEFAESAGVGVFKEVCIYGMEEQLLLCAKTSDSQFAVDIHALNYKGAAIIEVKTNKNTYLFKAVF